MRIFYQIFEIREVEEKVIFAGYSDGYGRETEKVYATVIPSWSSIYETEEEAFEGLEKKSEDFTMYEIKKIYRSE